MLNSFSNKGILKKINKEIENTFIQNKLDLALSVNASNIEKLNILQQNIEANNKAEESLNSLRKNIEANNKKLSSKIDTINYSSNMQYLTVEELSVLRDISNPKEGEIK